MFSQTPGMMRVLTNIERDVLGFNNRKLKAMVQELPLSENKQRTACLLHFNTHIENKEGHRLSMRVGTDGMS